MSEVSAGAGARGERPDAPGAASGRPSHALDPLAARLEAVLFSASEPVGLPRLAAVAGVAEARVRRALAELAAHLDVHRHGTALVEIGGGFQLLTRPEHADAVSDFTVPRLPPLSRAALETLAIVAFRQPVTRAVIDELRGVHSEGAVATLLERGLIAESGRAEAPGRPFLFVTTRRFLEHVGLRSLDDLASMPGLEAMLRGSSARVPGARRLLPAGGRAASGGTLVGAGGGAVSPVTLASGSEDRGP